MCADFRLGFAAHSPDGKILNKRGGCEVARKCSDIGPESMPEALDERVRIQAARGSQPWPRNGPTRDPKNPNFEALRVQDLSW